jgi:hypothetical protein
MILSPWSAGAIGIISERSRRPVKQWIRNANAFFASPFRPAMCGSHFGSATRALLSFDQAQLADAVGVSRKTISWIEIMSSEDVDPRRRKTLEDIRSSLKAMGVEFTFATASQGEGVRLKRPPRRKG